MKINYTKKNIIYGALIYSIGDTLAAYLINEQSLYRFIGMAFIGATLYAAEIPTVYDWIEKKTLLYRGFKKSLIRSTLATLYFNPLWILRHLIIIKFLSDKSAEINLSLIDIAFWTFLVNIPISYIGNHIIQNKIRSTMRFFASAIFSGLMAIYYAYSLRLFS